MFMFGNRVFGAAARLILAKVLVVLLTITSMAGSVEEFGVYSRTLRKTMAVNVMLPEGYSRLAGTRFPVLYLLHGYGGDHTSYTKGYQKARLYCDSLGIIMVCPDAGSDRYYIDSPIDPTSRVESYITRDLIPYIDSAYRTIAARGRRGIVGMSMGGHGALYLALRNQHLFGVAGSMSGVVDLRSTSQPAAVARVIGSQPENPANWERYSVNGVVKTLTQTPSLLMRIDCGYDDPFIMANRQLNELLCSKDILHEYDEYPGGHTQAYWEMALPLQIEFMHNFFLRSGENGLTSDEVRLSKSCGSNPKEAVALPYPEGLTRVSPSDTLLRYLGRVTRIDHDASYIAWPASGVSLAFEGQTLAVVLDDRDGDNFFQAVIDGDSDNPVLIDCSPGERAYLIADNLPAGVHTVVLQRRTDPTTRGTLFRGFLTDGKARFQPKSQRRRIEFYGDSITSGHGIDDCCGTCNAHRRYWDGTATYAAQTARLLNTDYTVISKSGIGISVSWYPQVMPNLFYRSNPDDSLSAWDFTQNVPDIVVVNLMQNDSWLVKKRRPELTRADIVGNYQKFLIELLERYPSAAFVCTIGPMDAARAESEWVTIIEEAAKRLASVYPGRVKACRLPYLPTRDHPTRREHGVIAGILANFIKESYPNKIQ